MNKLIPFPLIVLVMAAVPLAAQLRWVPANNGINGASPRAMAFNRSGDLLASTGMGLYRSDDGGARWTLVDTALGFDGMLGMGSDTLFGYRRDGLFRSDDGGGSWRLILPGGDIRVVAVDAANGYIFVNAPGALLYSRDGGERWESAASPGLDGFGSLAVDSGGVLYAGGANGLRRSVDHGMHWAASGYEGYGLDVVANAGTIFLMDGTGIHRSTDGGAHWTMASVLRAHTLRIDSNGDLWAASLDHDVYRQQTNGLYRSTDNGATWVRRSSRDFLSLWIAPAGELVADVDGAISLSTDQGATWLRRDEGLKNFPVASVAADSLGRLYVLVPTSGQISRSGYLRRWGLYRSLDHGESWSLVKDSLAWAELTVGRDGALYAGVERLSRFPDWDYITPSTVRSSDGGMTWETIGGGYPVGSLTGPGPLIIGFSIAEPSTGGSAAYSFDDGRSWSHSTFKRPVSAVAGTTRGALLVAARYSDDAGRRDYMLHRSADSGVSWSESPDDLKISMMVAGTRGEVYAATEELGPDGDHPVYRSTDAGATWSLADGIFANSFAVDPLGNVFACRAHRSFRSTDGGESWRAADVAPFAFIGDRMISHGDDGIYLSRDGGITNTLLASYPYGAGWSFGMLVADMDGHLFSSSPDRGLFRTSGVASAPLPGGAMGSDLALGASVPNPATCRASIPFTLASPGRVHLVLHDMMGRTIMTLIDGSLSAGEHSAEADLSRLPRGAYLYVLTAGSSVRSGMIEVR